MARGTMIRNYPDCGAGDDLPGRAISDAFQGGEGKGVLWQPRSIRRILVRAVREGTEPVLTVEQVEEIAWRVIRESAWSSGTRLPDLDVYTGENI